MRYRPRVTIRDLVLLVLMIALLLAWSLERRRSSRLAAEIQLQRALAAESEARSRAAILQAEIERDRAEQTAASRASRP